MFLAKEFEDSQEVARGTAHGMLVYIIDAFQNGKSDITARSKANQNHLRSDLNETDGVEACFRIAQKLPEK